MCVSDCVSVCGVEAHKTKKVLFVFMCLMEWEHWVCKSLCLYRVWNMYVSEIKQHKTNRVRQYLCVCALLSLSRQIHNQFISCGVSTTGKSPAEILTFLIIYVKVVLVIYQECALIYMFDLPLWCMVRLCCIVL